MTNLTENREAALNVPTTSLLSRTESYELELKRNVKAIDAKVLVSFANSVTGGVILAGVDEGKDGVGRQIARVVGARYGDEEKRDLQSRAEQCQPPVPFSYRVESINGLDVVRVEVESSPSKPHCTSGGTYCVRRDGKISQLSPRELLALFVEHEGNEFLLRYREATSRLEQDIKGFENRVGALQEQFERAERRLVALIGAATDHAASATASAIDSADQAEAAAGTAEMAKDAIESIHDYVTEVGGAVEYLTGEAESNFKGLCQGQADILLWLEEIGISLGLTEQNVYENSFRRRLLARGKSFGEAISLFSKDAPVGPRRSRLRLSREILVKIASHSDFSSVPPRRRAKIVSEVWAELRAAEQKKRRARTGSAALRRDARRRS